MTLLRLLILDACVLIDLLKADPSVLTTICRCVGQIHVPDQILDEVDQLDWDGAVALGLIPFVPASEVIVAATSPIRGLSLEDRTWLHAAVVGWFDCDVALKERWNDGASVTASVFDRDRYQRLHALLVGGNLEVRVVPRTVAPFLHGKAGVIERADGSKTSFIGSNNETREGWANHYELAWEDDSAEAIAWVEEEFDALWAVGIPLPVDMLNLVYHGTRDEDVYERLSERMKDRFDIFGSLPDVIEDEWIEDLAALDARLSDFIERRRAAVNAFEVRYGETVDPKGEPWERCTTVLARADVVARLSRGWAEKVLPDGL